MIDRDEPAVSQLLEKGALFTPIDESLSCRIDFINAAAGVVANGAAVGKNIIEGHACAKAEHRLIVDPAELFVYQLKTIVGVVETDTLWHIGDSLLEALSKGARARETPRQIVAKRGEDLCKPAADA